MNEERKTIEQAGQTYAEPHSSELRPTDHEIDLEARQWAQEYATRCMNSQFMREAIFAAGARWARSISKLNIPNAQLDGQEKA